MKIINRIGLVILFSIVGAIVMRYYNLSLLRGSFVEWESLGKPPSTVTKLIGLGYVQTESGDTYQYIPKPNCKDDCWVKSDNPDLHAEFWLPLEKCVDLPPTENFVDSKAICEMWGPGRSLTVDAIDQNGNVYSWSHRVGESFIYFLAPYIGAIFGFLLGCVVIIGLLFSDLIKGQQKKTENVSSQVKVS